MAIKLTWGIEAPYLAKLLGSLLYALALLGRVCARHRKEDVDMEVLSSRVLLRPASFDRSLRFYAETLDLHVYREWGSGTTRGVVFFLGSGFLELSGSLDTPSSEKVSLWLQVRDVDGLGDEPGDAGNTLYVSPREGLA